MSRRGRGEGSVYKRSSDGRWVAVIDYGIEHGHRDRKALYGRTKREVLDKRRDFLAQQMDILMRQIQAAEESSSR